MGWAQRAARRRPDGKMSGARAAAPQGAVKTARRWGAAGGERDGRHQQGGAPGSKGVVFEGGAETWRLYIGEGRAGQAAPRRRRAAPRPPRPGPAAHVAAPRHAGPRRHQEDWGVGRKGKERKVCRAAERRHGGRQMGGGTRAPKRRPASGHPVDGIQADDMNDAIVAAGRQRWRPPQARFGRKRCGRQARVGHEKGGHAAVRPGPCAVDAQRAVRGR